MFDLFWIIYLIGVIIAFFCACIDAYIELQNGTNIDEFPAMVVLIFIFSLFSWTYVYFFIDSRYF